MTKVIWKGLIPPDDPRYKEPYAIVVQPSEAEIEKTLDRLEAEGRYTRRAKQAEQQKQK